MSEFMIRQFSLDKVSAFHNAKLAEEVGKKVNHNWSALSSTLFITTNYGSLFGDVAVDGLSNRLMNMYLGLPWISTYTALKTVQSQIKSENKVDEIHSNKEIERKKNRYQEVTLELNEKEELIKSLPSDKSTREKLFTTRVNYGQISRELTSLDKALRKLSEELELIKETWKSDRIRVNNFKEDKAANVVFKRLNPTCCPHCEREIDKSKIEKEKTSHQCAICDSALLESEDSEVLLKELVINMKASEKAYKEIQQVYNKKYKSHSILSASLLESQKQIDQYESELQTFSERIKVEKEITRLLVLKEEYSTREEKTLESAIKNKAIDEKKIIAKAIEITKGRFEELQKELLIEVSEEILRISKLVGLNNIEKVNLTSVPHLKLEKDGSTTSYSKVSEGEKLRLKVITTIALLSVAEKRKVGRHPGLLLIDSPGAQEVSDNDVNSLIEGLKELTTELPFLQIIIASRATDVILNQIDIDHRKHAKGNDYLW
jgi:tetratricopeptide (TPR) repeat protein